MRGCSAHDPAEPAVCAPCAAVVDARAAGRRRLVVGGVLTLVIGGGAAFLLTRGRGPAPAAPVDAGDPVDGFQRARLAQDPCDAETSRARMRLLVEANRLREAKVFATGSIARCGVIGRMKWSLAYVDQQLHDYADTERVTTELIAAEPDDSDFWWWRGEALAYAGKPAAALADYRQSLALSAGAQAGQFAADRLALPATALHEPCEADRAWRFYVRELGGEPAQEMRDATAAAVRDRSCADELGAGRLVIAPVVRVTLGDGGGRATGQLRVDAGLGTTLISRQLAARSGLVVEDAPLAAATAGGKLYRGVPMRVALAAGGARARGVDVLVTDDLPGDDAGILGLSFLWHFAAPHADARGAQVVEPFDPRPL